MARDLNNKNGTVAANSEQQVNDPGPRRSTTLAGELAADAYNIVVALAILSLSYWLVFRSLPVELFTLGLAATLLIAINVIVAVRGSQV